MKPSNYLAWLIRVVVGLAELALAFRVVLRLFAANPTASFVHWVYITSSTLLAPFRGIFPSEVVAHNHVLDFSALFALIVYALLGSFLLYLAYLLETPVRVKK